MTTTAVQSPPDAARFVERFADGWAGPHPERLLDLLHPDVRLIQPIFPPTLGRAAAEARLFRPLFRFMPDMRLAVVRWSAAGDAVFIEWWKAERARTSPSSNVTVMQTGIPSPSPRSIRLAAEPCTKSASPTRA